jgi:WhiB family redox-sensing transcriptional regulator
MTTELTNSYYLPFDTSLAACRGSAEISLFYPKGESSAHVRSREQKKAISICMGCEVREPCAEYAIKNESFGIWGGMTESEREYHRIERNIALPQGTVSDVAKRTRRLYNDKESKRRKRQALALQNKEETK